MSIITYTTDFGNKNFLFSQIKGMVASAKLGLQLIEITHDIEPFNLIEASYSLKNTYCYFPKNSIHIISVGSQSFENFLVAYIDHHYFITSDNGFLSLLFDEQLIGKFYYINKTNKPSKFPCRDYFTRIAIDLIEGKELSDIGTETNSIVTSSSIQPSLKGNTMTGHIIYLDNYGNAVTNFKREFLLDWLGNHSYSIHARNDVFHQVHETYSCIVKDTDKEYKYHGKPLVLFNSSGHLEIAIYKSQPNSFGSAQTLYNLSYGDAILIEKHN